MTSGVYMIKNMKSGKFYIGSSVNIEKRFIIHKHYLRQNKHPNPKLQYSWNKHGEEHFIFNIIEVTNPEQAMEREQFWIDNTSCINIGYNIAEIASAPMLGKRHSEESRKKMSEALKGKKKSKEHIEIMSKNRIGKKASQESKERMRLAQLKRGPTSDETRRKLSEASKNRPPCSEETKLKISVAAKNRKPPSEETRLKWSIALKGNKNGLGHKWSKEDKEKMSQRMAGNTICLGRKQSKEHAEKSRKAALGKKHTEEQRKRKSIAAKKAWETRKLKQMEP